MTAATDLANIDPLRTAREAILAPAGLDVSGVEQALGLVLGSAVDSADLYFQLSREESWGLEDGIVKEGSASIEQGVGVRALAGEKTGFAYSDEIMRPALEEAARAARAIAVRGGQGAVQAWRPVAGHQLYPPDDPLLSLADEQKIAWLERIDRATRRMDPRVVQVMASVHAVHEVVLVAASDGVLAGGRAATGAHECHRDRRTEWPARAGLRRLRWPLSARRAGCRRSAAGAGARSRAPGAGESRSRAGTGRHHECRARSRLARRAAARGDWPRAGGRLQSQGHLRLQRPHRRARGGAGLHGGRRWRTGRSSRLAQHR